MTESNVETYKIGEVAKKADVNKETVRYYERRGMINTPDRRRSGYRIFTRQHIDQIRFIKRAQELGFTLAEIKELLTLRLDDSTSCDVIRKQAESKYRDVQEKINDLSQIKSILAELIASCKANKKTEDCVILKALEGETETGKQLR